MNDTTIAADTAQTRKEFLIALHSTNWTAVLVLGIVTLIFGTLGLFVASAVTLATVYVFGALMMISGAFIIAQAIAERNRSWGHRIANILIGLVYFATAVIVFVDPRAASLALTIIVASLFMAIGIIRLMTAWKFFKAGESWAWLALAGLINVLFGGFVAFTLPVSHIWVIGILVSVEMIMQGWLMILAAMAARELSEEEKHAAQAQHIAMALKDSTVGQ